MAGSQNKARAPVQQGCPLSESRNAGPHITIARRGYLVRIPSSVHGWANGVEMSKRYAVRGSSPPLFCPFYKLKSHRIKLPERRSSWIRLLFGVTAEHDGTAPRGTLSHRTQCASFTQPGKTRELQSAKEKFTPSLGNLIHSKRDH